MTHDFLKNLTQKKNWNGRSVLMFAGVLGVLLIFSGNSLQKDQKISPAANTLTESVTTKEYTTQLENNLTELLGYIDGAGKVQVVVTLESSTQKVYALDQKKQSSTGNQETEHIILNQQNGQDALVEMIWEPEIRGVAVVCEGADSIAVCSQITEAVSVLTGVSTNRISIAKMS